jgi:hypothetical protein
MRAPRHSVSAPARKPRLPEGGAAGRLPMHGTPAPQHRHPEGGAAGGLSMHDPMAPTEGSSVPRMTAASAPGRRPCASFPGEHTQRRHPEGGAAGRLPVHDPMAPTEGSSVPRMTAASALGTRPCAVRARAGSVLPGDPILRSAPGLASRSGSSRRLPQNDTGGGENHASRVLTAVLPLLPAKRGRGPGGGGPRPCRALRHRTGCPSTSPRGFWGRCEPKRAVGAFSAPAQARLIRVVSAATTAEGIR